jgi:orotidine-5'-phosphate decarboxylase
MTFTETLHARTLELNTRLCLGLDPRPEMHPSTHPDAHDGDLERLAASIEKHCLDTLEACAELICAVKPNLAYYEALGLPGMRALESVCRTARGLRIPIILDGKRGDFPSTAEAYAKAWLSDSHAGNALTVNPFLGFETLETFLTVARVNHGGVFVLVKTSNPGSRDIQDLETKNGTVAQVIASHLAGEANGEYGPVGAVVGATHAAELADWRARMPGVLLLLPGLGAQGAKPEDLAPAFDANGLGAVATASRALQYASAGTDYAPAARRAATTLRDRLNAALGG